MNDQLVNTSTLNITGEVRIVGTSRMNFCLDSTNTPLTDDLHKVLAYQRGTQENQIWTITDDSQAGYKIISDNTGRKLASCDIDYVVGITSASPEDDLMYCWEIERRKGGLDWGDFMCGEFYIKNVYSNQYLTLRDNNDITLEDKRATEKGQVWILFENKDLFQEDRKNINFFTTRSAISDTSLNYLKRLHGDEQPGHDFTKGQKTDISLLSDLDYLWEIIGHPGGDNTIENRGGRLVSQDGYAMVFYDDSTPSENQYWFIDFLTIDPPSLIITNRADGKVLKHARAGGNIVVQDYTLFSTSGNSGDQHWFLSEPRRPEDF